MEVIAKEFKDLTTTELYEILKSRSEIFLLEQNIICQDMDDIDYVSTHFFIKDKERVAAYLRAYNIDGENVKVGRVLTLSHGNGMGRELLEKSIEEIKNRFGCRKICVNAQKQAAGFYEKSGFKKVSDEFLEEGIVHIAMQLEV